MPLTWSRKGVPALQGRPGGARTEDGGRHWGVVESGLPAYKDSNTFRHCMSPDREGTVGIYFGTREGDLFASIDEGDPWKRIAAGLPSIRAVATTGEAE